MPDDGAAFRLTFNKPAALKFFERDVAGLQIKIEDGKVMLRPVANVRGQDTVSLTERSRGGHEVVIEGSLGPTLLELLQKESTANRPFFILHRLPQKGWIGLQHFDGKEFPPKYEPHVRFWPPKGSLADQHDEAPVATGETTSAADAFITEVRKAKKIIDEYRFVRKVGRPPREVTEARELLETFEDMVKEILPERAQTKPPETFALVEARALINSFLASMNETKASAEPTSPEPEPEPTPSAEPRATRKGKPSQPLLAFEATEKRGRGATAPRSRKNPPQRGSQRTTQRSARA